MASVGSAMSGEEFVAALAASENTPFDNWVVAVGGALLTIATHPDSFDKDTLIVNIQTLALATPDIIFEEATKVAVGVIEMAKAEAAKNN